TDSILRLMSEFPKPPRLRPIPALIFASRWLQLPLYLGLIVAQGVYVYQFWQELVHLMSLVWTVGRINETEIMLVVLGLIDVVMIANLLIMVKLATAIIGISSIHLLKTFINADHITQHVIMWQVAIHLTFLVSALAVA